MRAIWDLQKLILFGYRNVFCLTITVTIVIDVMISDIMTDTSFFNGKYMSFKSWTAFQLSKRCAGVVCSRACL